MTNNDILRSIRYILNVNETKILEIIALADFKVSKDDLTAFLKQEDEAGYKNCGDKVLANFLNGLVIYKRGKNESTPPQPIELSLTNNIILKKLRVAFALKDSDIISLIEKSGLKVSKTELSAFFRKQDHRNYRDCGNQFLRNLLRGMAL
jgi:uncharacterized protein YehS (DUF1456 family)